MPSYLSPIPASVRRDIANLAADVIEAAAQHGERRWGSTPYVDGVRINVGWTEIITALPDHLRLIVDGDLARTALGTKAAHILTDGSDERGFYPTVPGSVLAELEYAPVATFRTDLETLRPAMNRAIALAARRRAGRGVFQGHRQQLVIELASVSGRALPSPGEASHEDNDDGVRLMEGALQRVTSSQYERNPAARQACVEHYGHACQTCGFSFEAVYGPIGAQYIHVHHIEPISSRGGRYVVDPVRDLIPVCPNCHAMLHRQDPPMTVAALRNSIFKPHEA